MSWVFYPFAYMLGVTSNHETTMKVAQLIGQKTVLNEFYAYQSMAIMLKNGDLDASFIKNIFIFDEAGFQPRSQMIAIFALCGYSNFSQIGSQIGIFQTFCAKRKKAFVKGAGRAMFAGEIACFMTACIAGLCRPNFFQITFRCHCEQSNFVFTSNRKSKWASCLKIVNQKP